MSGSYQLQVHFQRYRRYLIFVLKAIHYCEAIELRCIDTARFEQFAVENLPNLKYRQIVSTDAPLMPSMRNLLVGITIEI